MFYEAIAQFAKADAPSFFTPGYEAYLNEAKDFFNMRSRVATNPKEITELQIVDDRTIRIIFRSHDKLNISQISRSLRVFSMYLIDETHPLNFSDLVSGKRLFRMTASEFASDTDTDIGLKENEATGDDLAVIKAMIMLLEDAKKSSKAHEYVVEIVKKLKEYQEEK